MSRRSWSSCLEPRLAQRSAPGDYGSEGWGVRLPPGARCEVDQAEATLIVAKAQSSDEIPRRWSGLVWHAGLCASAEGCLRPVVSP
jgi:hypothetical protein